MVQPNKLDIFQPQPSRTKVKLSNFTHEDMGLISIRKNENCDNNYKSSKKERRNSNKEKQKILQRDLENSDGYFDAEDETEKETSDSKLIEPIHPQKLEQISSKPDDEISTRSSVTNPSIGRNMRAEAWQMELINKRLNEQMKKDALRRIIDDGKANNL